MEDSLPILNEILASQSYIYGFTPTSLDRIAFSRLKTVPQTLVHLNRWHRHLKSFSSTELDRFENVKPSNGLGRLGFLKENDAIRSNEVKSEQKPLKMTVSDGQTAAENLPEVLLSVLDKAGEFDTSKLAEELKLDHNKVIGAVKSLLSHENLIDTKDRQIKQFALSGEGKEISDQGSHEYRVFQEIGADGVPQKQIVDLSFGKIGMSKALANKWIALDKSASPPKLVRKVEQVKDEVREALLALKNNEDVAQAVLDQLKKRKLISETTIKALIVTKGDAFTVNLEKPEVDITAEMIATGSWKDKTFKKYNFEALGVPPPAGHLHPLLKVRSEFREIFFQMGFTEMATNKYVESSFWNFDALFQPQMHPARDAHDTFFLKDPAVSTEFPQGYLERVKKVHSEGGYGSVGYKYDWKIEEAQKNVLRTHTTAVSARQLYQLAQNGFKPSKYFSIDRVFRNETLDATHLAEFHQVEGVVAERNLSLAHVIGLFTEFFRKCGIENLRFKHTYNPYTEPSMEIYAYHDGLKKWVEIGNSGLFRPEMLLPMGLPPDVNVAGFGLSLERPTMIRYGISNIRELFGHKIDLNMVYKNPVCRLEKK
ncbi:unnamed protein product [Bursaphelenchus okinawaensis]|uniref:phenylalanine--tRNA ligase n=1 Tax=Bursaphelenchus okinawaensis TaxID=465554 RepID=A0A811LMT5_9BILA|nr:unnamed protein product [Bursaphelenchus okinawaensis]CAG9124443.1 unnamed protein product [Bursaphelenchus okinawaensis]